MSVNVKIIVDYNTLPQEEGEFIKRTVTFIDNLSGIETKIHEDIVPKRQKQAAPGLRRSDQLRKQAIFLRFEYGAKS